MKKNNSNKKFKKILAFVCACILCFIVMFFVLLSAFQPLIIFGADEPTDEPSFVPVVKNLTNTTWSFNTGVIDASRSGHIVSGVVTDTLTGISYNFDKFYFGVDSSGPYEENFTFFYNNQLVVQFDVSKSFEILFTPSNSPSLTDTTLISLFYAYGELVMVRDLTGSKWHIPSGWIVDSGYGHYNGIISINNSTISVDSYYWGFSYSSDDLYIPSSDTISYWMDNGSYTEFYSSDSLDIDFLGVYRPDLSQYSSLINWLYNFGYMTSLPIVEQPDVPVEPEEPDEPVEPVNYVFGEFINELKPFVNFDPINSDDVYQTYNYEFYSLDGKYYNQIEASCVKKIDLDPRKYDFNVTYKNTLTNESILVYSAEYIYDTFGPEFIHYNDNIDAIYNFYRFIQFRDGVPILNFFLSDNLILMDFDGDELYFLGYNQGHLDTYQPAYDKGYQDGFISDLLGDTLEGPIDALDSVILFTSTSGVTITIWTVLNAVIGLSLFIWFMKMFSGG